MIPVWEILMSELDKWLGWARQQADRIGPFKEDEISKVQILTENRPLSSLKRDPE
jgi:hypothetical protein